MKFVIFGSTGPSGQQLVEECLQQGHCVTALVRNPDKMSLKHENLTVNKVDLAKEEDLVPHVTGSDAVLSCLGAPAGIWVPCSLYTDTIKTITGAMRKGGVSRYVGMSAWGTKHDPGLPWIIRWVLRPLFLRNILPNMAEMEDYLSESCTDIDYTVVRPPGLTNDQASGKEALAFEGQYVPDATSRIPRRDIAKFMLACVVNGEWKKKHVAVGIK
ncbi:flavin reductase (NADPH)-like [Haliotis cracherodii]|uniref:flavin reductase (NADPH)-like n=1 Tax=Haliotis cracherodii TaxID=6455 RepID=UPI0039E9B57D